VELLLEATRLRPLLQRFTSSVNLGRPIGRNEVIPLSLVSFIIHYFEQRILLPAIDADACNSSADAFSCGMVSSLYTERTTALLARPHSAPELAVELSWQQSRHAHSQSLYRLLKALAALGPLSAANCALLAKLKESLREGSLRQLARLHLGDAEAGRPSEPLLRKVLGTLSVRRSQAGAWRQLARLHLGDAEAGGLSEPLLRKVLGTLAGRRRAAGRGLVPRPFPTAKSDIALLMGTQKRLPPRSAEQKDLHTQLLGERTRAIADYEATYPGKRILSSWDRAVRAGLPFSRWLAANLDKFSILKERCARGIPLANGKAR